MTKKNVETFKALRIISIMLFCPKTNKTVRTGCSISPFTTTTKQAKTKLKQSVCLH